MAEISKSDAIDYAASVRKMVNALIDEGFTKEEAFELIKNTLRGAK